MLAAPLDGSPGVSIHNAVSPARAEADEGFVVFVLVNDLVRVSLAGITASVEHLPFAVPATANLDEVIPPSRFVNSLLVIPDRICKQVFFSCGHVRPLCLSVPEERSLEGLSAPVLVLMERTLHGHGRKSRYLTGGYSRPTDFRSDGQSGLVSA